MMDPIIRGEGTGVLLVHGSATTRDTWMGLLAAAPPALRLIAYDRRLTFELPSPTVGEHAADLCELAQRQQARVLVGSSFGAVCALEAVRTEPQLFDAVVLIEPPIQASEGAASVPEAFFSTFLDHRKRGEDAEAVRFFLRIVLGADFAQLSERVLAKSIGLADQVEADCRALLSYRPRFSEMKAVLAPTLLLEGARSPRQFRLAVDALERALPKATRTQLERAGHMLHAEAPRAVSRALLQFLLRQSLVEAGPGTPSHTGGERAPAVRPVGDG